MQDVARSGLSVSPGCFQASSTRNTAARDEEVADFSCRLLEFRVFVSAPRGGAVVDVGLISE